MKLTRRELIGGAGALAGLAAALPGAAGAASDGRYRPVRTPNGWTLPYRMRGGVKEFHLVAEEIEHEFAPGSKAKCWGYNGSTPGPTIEAVEGDRVRILVTNRLARAHHHPLARHPAAERHGRRRRPEPAAHPARARPTPTSSRCASTAPTCTTRTPTR